MSCSPVVANMEQPPRLKGKISSNIDDLNRLNTLYPWIPSESQVRPTPEIKAKKEAMTRRISENWENFTDYILHTVFGKRKSCLFNKFTVHDRNVESEIVFKPNEFAYQVEGNHFVLWFGTSAQELPDDAISDIIHAKIEEHLELTGVCKSNNTNNIKSNIMNNTAGSSVAGSNSSCIIASDSHSSSSSSSSSSSAPSICHFDFAWYINPKMTVPEFFHVQVFWASV